MRKFLFLGLLMAACAAPCLGQALFTGSYARTAVDFFGAQACLAPNFCAYSGADLIPTPTPPNFNADVSGLVNNGATSYDTSFLGHLNNDGSIFSNSALLSPLTRITDSVSVVGITCPYNQAGLGGSSDLTLVNTNSSLASFGCGSLQHVCLFNASGSNKGHCTAIGTGIYLTTNMNIAGGGSSSQAEDFGSPVFSQTNPAAFYTFGTDAYDITTPTTVCPYTINYATNTPLTGFPIGDYSLGTCIVDFKWALPAQTASNWATGTHYPYGAYVIHPLTQFEMAGLSLYEPNTDDTLTGWRPVCVLPSCNPGGVNAPAATNQTINNASPSLDGDSMFISITSPSAGNSNALWSYIPSAVDTASSFISQFSVYPSSNSASAWTFEYDTFLFSTSLNTEYMFGHQCNQVIGYWQVWNQLTVTWVTTNLACSGATGVPPSTWTALNFSGDHRVVGDTNSCSGQPCMYFPWIEINGTVYPITCGGVACVEPASTLPSGWTSGVGNQFQIDVGPGSTTITENIDLSNFGASSGGQWSTGLTIVPGDIIDSGLLPGATYHCMYKATTGGTTAGTTPAFVKTTGTSANPCKNDAIKESTTGGGLVAWKGTDSQPQFLYQNTTSTCSTYCTSGTVSTWLTNDSGDYHPDLFGTAADSGSGGFTWTNVGPSYVPTTGAQLWTALGGIGGDTAYGGNPSQYSLAISTNSYGDSLSGIGYNKYNSIQGTGIWNIVFDAAYSTYGTFHLLNSGTGIWTDVTCGSGNGFTCGSPTITTIGGLTSILNPLGTSQACPFLNHNNKLSLGGQYVLITNQVNVYSACNSLQNFFQWTFNSSAFCASLTACGGTPGSLQITDGGLNHWAIGNKKLFALEAGTPFGYTSGVFSSIYNNSSVSTPPLFGSYLTPLATQATAQTIPPGCYVSIAPDLPLNGIKTPDCNLSEFIDGHPSLVAGDSMPAVGAFYNYATLGPAFNAWQNMVLGFPMTPTGCDPSVNSGCSAWGNPSNPGVSFGSPYQFTHLFSTANCSNFDCTFSTGQYSQDGNWFFFTSDLGCTTGSTTGSAPIVWSSGTYYQTLSIAALPANPTSLCGYPWIPSTAYVAGQIMIPIEGTSGPGSVDDAFQVLINGTTGANSTLASNQPACLQYMLVSGTWTANTKGSCFQGTNPPSVTALTVTAAGESGTTGTFGVSGITLNDGALVTLAGFTWTGGTASGTYAVTGTVGTDCPGTNCGSITTFKLAGLPSGLGSATTLGTVASQGDTVCDSPSDNGSGSVNSFNPSSCPGGGVISSDRGPQTQRGDVFGVNLGNTH